ncbi:MAG: diacylglycerol/lipid kinase family protein [Lishizhenia sp.]
MKKHIRFIINPISGIGKKNKLPDMIEKYLDHTKFDYDIAFTEYRKHARLLAQASVEEKVDIVCAVGGDGSVNEVGSALVGSNSILAILPAGSGNGLARHLKLPMSIKKSILEINKLKLTKIDTGKINKHTFLGVTGFGFDALIAKRFDAYHTRGFLSYIKLVIKEYIASKPINIKVNEKRLSSIVICCVANSSQFGNGFCVSPNSDIKDGKLELFFLKKFPWYAIPELMIRFFRCSVDKSKYTQIESSENFKIELENSLVHIDGEPEEVKRELFININPMSLNVIVGQKF